MDSVFLRSPLLIALIAAALAITAVFAYLAPVGKIGYVHKFHDRCRRFGICARLGGESFGMRGSQHDLFSAESREDHEKRGKGSMNFNSLSFLLFLPLDVCLYWCLPHKFRWILLLIASYYFYMCWNVKLIFLILTTTAVSYVSGLCMERASNIRIKKLMLGITLFVCLRSARFL